MKQILVKKCLLIGVLALLVNCSQDSKKSYRHSIAGSLVTNEPDAKDQTLEEKPSVSLRDAYLTHVYPALKEHCTSCHMHVDGGTHPFGGDNKDSAVQTAQNLIGTSLENSRFYLKPKNDKHPTQAISETALPAITAGLTKFFAELADANKGIVGILTPEVKVSSAKLILPSISNMGLLVFEAEGSQLNAATKFEIANGPFSNNYAIGSNRIEPHATSLSPRTLTFGNNCNAEENPNIQQVAHTNETGKNLNGDLGSAKYYFDVEATLINSSGAKVLNLGNDLRTTLFKMLPQNSPIDQNYATNQASFDALFRGEIYDPSANVQTWNTEQIDTAIAYVRDQVKRNPNNTNLIDVYNNQIAPAIATNPAQIFQFFTLNYIRRAGPFNAEFRRWNEELAKIDVIASITNLHPNEVVPISTFSTRNIQIARGNAQFKFQMPDILTLDETPNGDLFKFNLWGLSSGRFNMLIKDSEGQIIQACSEFVAENNSANRWVRLNREFNFQKGKTYILEIFQRNETTSIDKFVFTEALSTSFQSPDKNPSVLRHPVYGLEANGKQTEVKLLEWPLSFGAKLQMELLEYQQFYGLQAPKIILDPANISKNILISGFDFKINTNIALSDRSFSVDAVRPSHAILTYGIVMIPHAKGLALDALAVNFTKLELTELPASLPKYEESPSIVPLTCKHPEIFTEWIWPLYTKQLVMLRENQNGGYQINPNYPFANNSSPTGTPTFYTCSTCHNESHPYFPIPNNPLDACDEALSRSNLNNPELSYALRGARGQFEHPAIYAVYNPWNTDKTLRQYTPPDGSNSLIYGPMLGAHEAYDLLDLENNASTLFPDSLAEQSNFIRKITLPRRIGFPIDAASGQAIPQSTPISIYPNDLRFNNQDLSTAFRKSSVDAPSLLNAHNAVIDIYVEKFIQWINKENEARK